MTKQKVALRRRSSLCLEHREDAGEEGEADKAAANSVKEEITTYRI